jgi:HK97 gp10 family phage protein
MRHTPVSQAAVARLANTEAVQRRVSERAEEIVKRAQELAPKRTGAGAASIHAEHTTEHGKEVERVSWDTDHDYMQFAEFGTVNETPRPFLRPAAGQYVATTSSTN